MSQPVKDNLSLMLDLVSSRRLGVQIVGTFLIICALVTRLHAQGTGATWIKIDDFESTETWKYWTKSDTRNDTDPRIENPQITEVLSEEGAENRYLIKKPAAEGVVGNRKALTYRALPVPVQVGETYTFYLRINVEYFPNNHVFGLSNLGPEGIDLHDYNAHEPSLRVTDKFESNGFKNDGTLMVRKDGGYEKVFNPREQRPAKPLQPGVWFEIWYVVNNARASDGGQRYDVYIRGGKEFQQQERVYVGADFRMKRDLPLIYFMANCNTGPKENPYGNGGLRYDDLYMAPGVQLTTPNQ